MSFQEQQLPLTPAINMEPTGSTPFEAYIKERFQAKGPQLYKASSYARKLGRELTEGEETTYREGLEKSASQLISDLQIEQSIFSDERKAEVFLAICDSMTALTLDEEHGDSHSAERIFLTRAARILAGDGSQYNKDALERGEEDSSLFVSHSPEQSLPRLKDLGERLERMFEHQDESLTEELTRACYDTSSASIFAALRERLHETPDALGKDWEIRVIDPTLEGTAGSPTTWEDLLGFKNIAAFVTTHNGKRILVYPAKQARMLLSGDKGAKMLFSHEAGHALRSNLISIGDSYEKLGIIVDEQQAFYVSQEPLNIIGHFNVREFFSWMSRTYYERGEISPENRVFDRTFAQALQKGSLQEYYQFVAENFGFRSLLMLMTFYPSANYRMDRTWGIPSALTPEQLPEVQAMAQRYKPEMDMHVQKAIDRGSSQEVIDDLQFWNLLHARDAAIMHTLLTEAVRIRPEARVALQQSIEDTSSTAARNRLELLAWTGYPDFVLEMLTARAQETDNPDVL